jgi:hypothetical protein
MPFVLFHGLISAVPGDSGIYHGEGVAMGLVVEEHGPVGQRDGHDRVG